MKTLGPLIGRLPYICGAMLTVCAFFSLATAQAASVKGAVNTVTNYGRTPLRFEENAGQMPSQVKYISRGSGYAMYFQPAEITLALDVSTNIQPGNRQPVARPAKPESHQMGVVHIKFGNANTKAAISSEQVLPEKIHYILGGDPGQWRTNISAFGKVRYQNLYPGVNLVFYGNQTQLEYDFEVAPHVDVSTI